MSRVHVCDCCKEIIIAGRETSDLKGFNDLCIPCYEGLLILKQLVQSRGKDVLKHLKIIANGRLVQ